MTAERDLTHSEKLNMTMILDEQFLCKFDQCNSTLRSRIFYNAHCFSCAANHICEERSLSFRIMWVEIFSKKAAQVCRKEIQIHYIESTILMKNPWGFITLTIKDALIFGKVSPFVSLNNCVYPQIKLDNG